MEIPSVVKDLINIAAPTLATALGGPLAGAAAALATKAIFGESASPKTPPELVNEILKNKDDPNLFPNLIDTERRLREFEQENQIKFVDLEYKNLQNIRDFQMQSGQSENIFHLGTRVIYGAGIIMLILGFNVILLMTGVFSFPDNPTILTVGFTFLSNILTAFVAWGAQVLSFYFGSSRSSESKSAAIEGALQQSGSQLGQAAADAAKIAAERAAAEREASREASAAAARAAEAAEAAATLARNQAAAAAHNVPQQNPHVDAATARPPASPPVSPINAPEWRQGPNGGARWRVLPEGVLVEGEPSILRTVGEPVTVRNAWKAFGQIMKAECLKESVPIEIGMMVLCTESAGKIAAILKEPDGRVSSGLMQVLTGTASEVLGREVSVEDLTDPTLNIQAGIAYIKSQKSLTWYDPILTAAAYNAGGLYKLRPEDHNRFNLRSTGDHIERAIRWYGDICFVSKAEGWFNV